MLCGLGAKGDRQDAYLFWWKARHVVPVKETLKQAAQLLGVFQ